MNRGDSTFPHWQFRSLSPDSLQVTGQPEIEIGLSL